MHRTQAELADGREIFFYDDVARDRVVDDTRDISRAAGGTELRRDPLLGEWVAVAAARQHRTHKPSTADCPLCPTTDERATEIPQADYDVVVFENRFPSFAGEELLEDHRHDAAAALTDVRAPGSGRCEVVCFTPEHTTSMSQLPVSRVRTVVDAWADRTADLLAREQIDQVFCFENRGEEIGVTLHHPHGQIYGYPFTTPRTRRMLEQARAHRAETGGDLFADVLAAEQADGARIVAAGEHFTAFVPAWARWPVEVQIFPHRAVRTLDELTDAERDDIAALYLDVLRRGDRLFGRPLPYISGWHQAPSSAAADDFRLHLQIFSIRRAEEKLKYLAGSESGMGVFINDIPPEQMAERLRAAGEDSESAEERGKQ